MLRNILHKNIGNVLFHFQKNNENKNFTARITKQIRLMLLPNCAVCGKKKSTFMKTQEASRLEVH